MLEESACTNSLTLFLQSLQKDRYSVDLLKLLNFENPSGSGPKKGYKRVRSKNISDERAKRTKSTKQSIISSIYLTELAKLEWLIKFNNQPEVPYGQILN